MIFNLHMVPTTILKALLVDRNCSGGFRATYLVRLIASDVFQTEYAGIVSLISSVLWHSAVIKLSLKTRWLVAKMRMFSVFVGLK